QRAENERLKVELAEASARADEHADRLDVYWKETAVIRAQLREAQATIERVRELFARLVSDFRNGTALGLVSVHLDAMERGRRQGDALEKLAAKALASAKPEPSTSTITLPALPVDESAEAEIDALVRAASEGKRAPVARPGW